MGHLCARRDQSAGYERVWGRHCAANTERGYGPLPGERGCSRWLRVSPCQSLSHLAHSDGWCVASGLVGGGRELGEGCVDDVLGVESEY